MTSVIYAAKRRALASSGGRRMSYFALSLGVVVLLSAIGIGGALALTSEGRRLWFAVDDTAMSVTGDVETSNTELMMLNRVYPLTFIRVVSPQEIWTIYNFFGGRDREPSPDEGPMMGRLYATLVPGNEPMRGENTFCGDDAIHWILLAESTYVPREMYMFPFYSAAPPDLSPGAKFHQESCNSYEYHQAP